MKRFLILLSLLFCNTVLADTINLYWLNDDGTTYQNSTCVIDSDLILPATPPTKYGYTFTGWKLGDYIPIEYLESTGTQWIDTGYIPSYLSTKIETVVTPLRSEEFSEAAVFSTGYFSTNNRFFLHTERKKYAIGMGQSYQVISSLVGNQNHIIFQYSGADEYSVQIDNDLYQYNIVNSNVPSEPIALYQYRSKNLAYPNKIYYFKIWDNNILVRDFIPVLDYNGVPCMLDKVEGKFYYNQGTGQFIAGPAL